MLGWLFGKLKWLLIIAAIGGPALAGYSWYDAQRREDVAKNGIEAMASIEGATRTKSRRGGTSYKIDLSWTDAKNQRRTVEGIHVSHAFANKIIVNDKIAVDSVGIRYIAEPGESENVIVADDTARQAETDKEMIYVGAGAGAAGMVGLALIFLVGRRQQPQTA